MATTLNNYLTVKQMKRTKIETTYEYKEILGGIFGFWRRAKQRSLGDTIFVEINTPMYKYDTLVINGNEIPREAIEPYLKDELINHKA